MSKHAPSVTCGCSIERLDKQNGPYEYYIRYCPAHKAGPRLLELIAPLAAFGRDSHGEIPFLEVAEAEAILEDMERSK